MKMSFTALTLVVITLANIQALARGDDDCQALLQAKYDVLHLSTDSSASQTLKSWYTSAEFKEWYKKTGFGGSVGYGGFTLGANSSDEAIDQFQHSVASATDISVSEQQKLEFLQTKGLEAVVNAYLDCVKLKARPEIIQSSVDSTGPEVAITITYRHIPGTATETTISSDPILFGLTPRGDAVFKKGVAIPESGIQASFAVTEGYPSPLLSFVTPYGMVTVKVPMHIPEKMPSLEAQRMEARFADVQQQLKNSQAENVKLQEENAKLQADAKTAQNELDTANHFLDLSGKSYRIHGDPGIYLVCGRSKIWVKDNGFDSHGLGVPELPELATIPLLDGDGPTRHRPAVVAVPR